MENQKEFLDDARYVLLPESNKNREELTNENLRLKTLTVRFYNFILFAIAVTIWFELIVCNLLVSIISFVVAVVTLVENQNAIDDPEVFRACQLSGIWFAVYCVIQFSAMGAAFFFVELQTVSSKTEEKIVVTVDTLMYPLLLVSVYWLAFGFHIANFASENDESVMCPIQMSGFGEHLTTRDIFRNTLTFDAIKNVIIYGAMAACMIWGKNRNVKGGSGEDVGEFGLI